MSPRTPGPHGQDARETLYLPAQSVVLNRTNYPDSYLTITQPVHQLRRTIPRCLQYTDSGTHSVQPVSAHGKMAQ